MRPPFALLLLAPLLAGCTSLEGMQRPDRPRVRLTPATLYLLERTYPYTGQHEGCRTQAGATCPVAFFRAVEAMGRRTTERRVSGDSADTVTLRVRDERHLIATAYRDGQVVEEQVLGGRLDEDGYFDFGLSLRPTQTAVVIWGLKERRGRLGLSPDGRLFVDSIRGGVAGLFILPIGGSSWETTYTFTPQAGSPPPRPRP